MATIEKFDFTPTEELVLDVLSARIRLGDNVWTFESRVRPTLAKLQAKGLIHFKSAPVENHELAWLTDDGKVLLFSSRYSERIGSKKLAKRQKELRNEAKRLKRSRS